MGDTGTCNAAAMSGDDCQEPDYKRRRTGVLATGYFNLIGLPGVSARVAGDPVSDPRNVEQIKFDGNANQLFYPPNFLTVKDDGVYAKKNRNNCEGYQEVRIGDVDILNNGSGNDQAPAEGGSIPLFATVTPSRTNEEIEQSANKAAEAIQKEVDIWTRRFYVFAGGDFCANRSLMSFAYPPQSVQTLGDHFILHPDMSTDGRWDGQYAKHVKIDLTNSAYGNIVFHTGKRQDDYQITTQDQPGVNLNRNKRLHFDAYLVQGTQASVEVIVGNASNGSGQEMLDQFAVSSTPTTYEKDITADMSDIKELVKFEMRTNLPNTQQQEYVLAITNMWFEWTGPEDERLFDKCFVKSWSTPVADTHFGVILQNTCFTYDQTLALYALLGSGDDERALVLLRALMYVINNDPDFDDARVRNGYRCGPAEPVEGDKGVIDVSLPGWYGREAWTTEAAKADGLPKEAAGNNGEYGQDPYAISIWTGTAAWVMMALTSSYRYYAPIYGDDETRMSDLVQPLYDKMIALSEWVVDRFKSTTDYFKGYMGGLYGFYTINYGEGEDSAPRVPAGVYKTPSGQYEGPGQFILPWRSVEHCADLYAAFKHLYDVTGNPKWGREMRHALDYIDKLWYDGPLTQPDGTEYDNLSMFLTGTGEVDEDLYNTVPNINNLPTDPTVWVTYGTDRLDATRLRALDFLHKKARVTGGDPNSMWKYSVVSNGGWIEGAGQVAILFKAYGLPSWWAAALAPCLDHQLESGIMYSVTETAKTGFTLPNVGLQDQPWKYFREGHMGATSWFVIGHRQINPFKFPVDYGTLAPSIDIRPEAFRNAVADQLTTIENQLKQRISNLESEQQTLSNTVDSLNNGDQYALDSRVTSCFSAIAQLRSIMPYIPPVSNFYLGGAGLTKEYVSDGGSKLQWTIGDFHQDIYNKSTLGGYDSKSTWKWQNLSPSFYDVNFSDSAFLDGSQLQAPCVVISMDNSLQPGDLNGVLIRIQDKMRNDRELTGRIKIQAEWNNETYDDGTPMDIQHITSTGVTHFTSMSKWDECFIFKDSAYNVVKGPNKLNLQIYYNASHIEDTSTFGTIDYTTYGLYSPD